LVASKDATNITLTIDKAQTTTQSITPPKIPKQSQFQSNHQLQMITMLLLLYQSYYFPLFLFAKHCIKKKKAITEATLKFFQSMLLQTGKSHSIRQIPAIIPINARQVTSSHVIKNAINLAVILRITSP
jgi:hypothetical protein